MSLGEFMADGKPNGFVLVSRTETLNGPDAVFRERNKCIQERAARSVYSYRSAVAPSVASTHRSKASRKAYPQKSSCFQIEALGTTAAQTDLVRGRRLNAHPRHGAGVKVEAMAAPNPLCPNVKGMCCLMLLLNLGLILVTLGFVIVLQFFEPLFVWATRNVGRDRYQRVRTRRPRMSPGTMPILGIVFLIFGFITLIGSLVYCVVLCRESPPQHPDHWYWTHHWSKTIGPSEIHYNTSEKPRQNGHRYNKYNGKYSDRESTKGYSDRESKLSRY
ncbi:hypothetical protein EVAR_10386_1 [Eumeta japonica]|uniref:Uncharacterized protein n=1 Tax=Eumeta variegata TaxID=151549 RepID=A0A4C1UDV9_EUMVA|nr:hypothetical protein EVAR_10386_1 [Eumeta japonica]